MPGYYSVNMSESLPLGVMRTIDLRDRIYWLERSDKLKCSELAIFKDQIPAKSNYSYIQAASETPANKSWWAGWLQDPDWTTIQLYPSYSMSSSTIRSHLRIRDLTDRHRIVLTKEQLAMLNDLEARA